MRNFIDIHTHTHNPQVLSVTNCFPQEAKVFLSENPMQYCSVGLHPWYAYSDFKFELASLEENTSNKQVLAIGEVGLDKVCISPFELQLEIFREQVLISEQCAKPIIIHCVKAYNELVQLKNEMQPTQPWVLHGFRGKAVLAKQLLSYGFYFSLGKGLENLEETVQALPLERIFLETDDGLISIQSRYELLASFKKISLEELKEIIYQNFSSVFNISK